MSERKVLNKYYPPEFDPSKIPKLRIKKTGVFCIRIMAPFNMRCNTCGEYIYKGKKFNSRKENVDDEDYLGLRIFRFYIRCPRCIAEIAFKTDLANTDYALEAGATRLFEAEKLAHQMAERERKEKEEDELNPMKLLENRTKASRNEMEQIDQLEELKEMNVRHARMDHESLLKQHMVYEEQLLKLQEEEEDNLVKAILGKGKSGPVIKRLHEDDEDEYKTQTAAKVAKPLSFEPDKPSDILVENPEVKQGTKPLIKAQPQSWKSSVGSFSKKTSLAGLVKKKTQTAASSSSSSLVTSSSSKSDTPDSHKTSLSSVNVDVKLETNLSNNNTDCSGTCVTNGKTAESKTVTGLGLLGDYSDSDSASD